MPQIDINPLSLLANRLEGITREAIRLAPNFVAAILFLLLTALLAWLAHRLIEPAFKRAKVRPALAKALHGIITSLIWAAGILIAAMIALPGLSPSELVAGLGIGSIAIGLAFRDIFENFLAGLLILMREPMRIGDVIECEGITGQVNHISIRDTYLRRTDGVLVMVPNAFLYKNPVRVLTDLDQRRQSITVGVAYGEDVDQARDVIAAALADLETVNKSRPIEIFACAFAASSIDFEVTWWTGSRPLDIRRSRDEVVAAVKRALDAAGIEIPFPYRTLTFKEPLRLTRNAMAPDDVDGIPAPADAGRGSAPPAG